MKNFEKPPKLIKKSPKISKNHKKPRILVKMEKSRLFQIDPLFSIANWSATLFTCEHMPLPYVISRM